MGFIFALISFRWIVSGAASFLFLSPALEYPIKNLPSDILVVLRDEMLSSQPAAVNPKDNSRRRSLKVCRDRERVPIWIHYSKCSAIPQETANLALCLQPGRASSRLGRRTIYDVTKGTR